MHIDDLEEATEIDNNTAFAIIRNGSPYMFTLQTLKSEVVSDG